jgi:hypothetical protein
VAAFVVACGSSADEAGSGPGNGGSGGGNNPAPKTCGDLSDCPAGTASCTNNFCVAQECPDADGDGAGVGPGCDVYDCDDSDPDVPGPSELQNGKDDDCDGLIDEGWPCVDDNGMPIEDGALRDCGGTGDCGGEQECTGGTWGSECVGGKAPSPEVCGNSTDENCDGTLDDGCCPAGEDICAGTAVCSSNQICN